MESLAFVDDLLNFSSDVGDEDDEEDKPRKALSSLSLKCSGPASLNALDADDPTHSFSEFAEEELEWISNKDAFPAVETYVDMLSTQPNLSKPQTPVSTLEYSASSINSNSSANNVTLLDGFNHVKVPVRARSKRHNRKTCGVADISSRQFWWNQPSNTITKPEVTIMKCQHCGAEKTPQWRAGPLGPKTLCNACGVRFKSGRLLPEYRPASSPTFCNDLHSNSHRKVVQMRKQKQMGGQG